MCRGGAKAAGPGGGCGSAGDEGRAGPLLFTPETRIRFAGVSPRIDRGSDELREDDRVRRALVALRAEASSSELLALRTAASAGVNVAAVVGEVVGEVAAAEPVWR